MKFCSHNRTLRYTRNMIRFLRSISSQRREEQSIDASVGVDAWQSALAVDR
jgi:hypothetical protein